jgi:hypothetical protein
MPQLEMAFFGAVTKKKTITISLTTQEFAFIHSRTRGRPNPLADRARGGAATAR